MEKLSQEDIRKFVSMGAAHRAFIKLLIKLEKESKKEKNNGK